MNGTAVLKPTLLGTFLLENFPHWPQTVTPSMKNSSVNGDTCLPMLVLGSRKGGFRAT